MIKVAPIVYSTIDRGTFMPAAKQVTGENHVTEVDQRPGLSTLDEDLKILRHFAGHGDLETAIMQVSFMVAGFSEDIEEFIAYTRGMPHMDTNKIDRRGVRCVVVSGSLDQWRTATIAGCRAPDVSPIKRAYNDIHSCFVQMGLNRLFDGYRVVHNQGNFLLEKK